MVRQTFFFVTLLTLIPLASPARADEAGTWMKLLKGCSGNPNTLGNVAQVYFGPSNSTGPGAVFKRDGHKQLSLRFDLGDLLNDYTIAPPAVSSNVTETKWFSVGHPASCSANNSVQWSVSGSIPIQGPIASGLSADVSASLDKASSVKLHTDGYRLIYLKMDNFGALVNQKDNVAYLNELKSTDDRIIEANTVQVLGVSVDYTFSAGALADGTLKAKLPSGTISTGPDGIQVNAKFISDTTYEISTPASFYLMGSYVTWPEIADVPSTGSANCCNAQLLLDIKKIPGPRPVTFALSDHVKVVNHHVRYSRKPHHK